MLPFHSLEYQLPVCKQEKGLTRGDGEEKNKNPTFPRLFHLFPNPKKVKSSEINQLCNFQSINNFAGPLKQT